MQVTRSDQHHFGQMEMGVVLNHSTSALDVEGSGSGT